MKWTPELPIKINFIGKKISHSLLPIAVKQLSNLLNVNFYVEPIVLTDDVDFFDFFKQENISGYYCITAPFKIAARTICTKTTNRATKANSVNVIKIINNEFMGDNTDGIGFIKDMRFNRINFTNKTVLILGAGGVVRGILAELLAQKPKHISLCNRQTEKLVQLSQEFNQYNLEYLTYPDLKNRHYDVVINGTSASIYHQSLPFPPMHVNSETIYLECAYAFLQDTPFARWAQSYGARTIHDGVGMLIEQLFTAFEFWFGIQCSSEPLRNFFLTPSSKEIPIPCS